MVNLIWKMPWLLFGGRAFTAVPSHAFDGVIMDSLLVNTILEKINQI